MIMACSTCVVSSSPYFFEALSYTLQKFQISHIYVADVAYISKGTIPLVYESNISRTRRVCMASSRSGKSICYQSCLSSWILSVIVWLLKCPKRQVPFEAHGIYVNILINQRMPMGRGEARERPWGMGHIAWLRWVWFPILLL